ncbi:hypothetical protein SGRIM128S_08731 [Streptomyces griseomycini]
MPVVGTLTGVLALRRVVASPLGTVRRVRPRTRPGLMFFGAVALFLGALFASYLSLDRRPGTVPTGPMLVVSGLALAGAAALWLVGAAARLTGRLLAARTGSPAVLIAAERLRDDPWAAARTHTVVLLVTVVGTGFVGIRRTLLEVLGSGKHVSEDLSFYTTGLDLTAAAIGVGLVITLSGLAVGTAESLATRRRTLAVQAAVGVPRAVLRPGEAAGDQAALAPAARSGTSGNGERRSAWGTPRSPRAAADRRRGRRCWCRSRCTRRPCGLRPPRCPCCAAQYGPRSSRYA